MNATCESSTQILPESHAVRILLVEDERLVALSLTRQLEKLGHCVVAHAAAGADAIRIASALRPDLVIMDIHLEGELDGVEAAAEIRKQLELPVIYLTAYSNPEVLDRAKQTEPLGYVLKPYEERDLHVAIETGLYRHRAECARAKLREAERAAQSDRAALPSLDLSADDRFAALSPRESQVMEMLVAGNALKQIAAKLEISFQTAAKHRVKVLEKLGVKNDVELVRFVVEHQKQSG